MTSVDKRRRERIRAKREARQQAKAETTREWENDGHVAEAPGRQARVRRRRAQKQRPRSVERLDDDTIQQRYGWLAYLRDQTIRRPSLRQRRAARRHEDHRPEERVRLRGMVWVSWRWLSTIISAFLIAIIYILWNSSIFKVNAISVGGNNYLEPEEVFEATNIANERVFKLDARDIEAHLETNPSIADAQVRIGWPPNLLSVYITERDPAIIWEQGKQSVWVDINGLVMHLREPRDDLVRVSHVDESKGPLGAGEMIAGDIVVGARQLKEILQEEATFSSIEDVLLFDPVKGLGFREDQGNWMAWFGTGSDMQRKWQVYQAIVRANSPMIAFSEVDVSDPDYPTYIDKYAEQ